MILDCVKDNVFKKMKSRSEELDRHLCPGGDRHLCTGNARHLCKGKLAIRFYCFEVGGVGERALVPEEEHGMVSCNCEGIPLLSVR